MNSIQQKNITKTVLALVLLMAVFLILFFNKITTPRYLTVMEHRINGLVILKDPSELIDSSEQWRLLVSTDKQQKTVKKWFPLLRSYIQEKTSVLEYSDVSSEPLPYDKQRSIGIVNPQGELLAYFKPPFDQQRMVMTYSSLITHFK